MNKDNDLLNACKSNEPSSMEQTLGLGLSAIIMAGLLAMAWFSF